MEQKYELYHHGILGMKWGVRRFQNEDGSYTQRGLERYRKSKEEYDRLKTEGASRSEIRSAKRKLSKDYDQLKRDYRADKGKKLYSKGETIRGNRLKAFLGVAATEVGGAVAIAGEKALARKFLEDGNMKAFWATNAAYYVTLGATALGDAAIIGKTVHDNRNLRAYYGHSTPKDADDTRSRLNAKKEKDK